METRVINEYQKEKYSGTLEGNKAKLAKITDALDAVSSKESVRVLDIGGGDGQFALLVHDYLCEKTDAEIYVVDNASYKDSSNHIGGISGFMKNLQ